MHKKESVILIFFLLAISFFVLNPEIDLLDQDFLDYSFLFLTNDNKDRGNFCLAHLKTDDSKIHKYYSISGLSNNQSKADELSKKHNVTFCHETEVLYSD